MIETKPIQVLRLKEVKARTGLSTSQIYEQMDAETFPIPIRLSTRRIGWIESEVDQWILDRVKERDERGYVKIKTNIKKHQKA